MKFNIIVLIACLSFASCSKKSTHDHVQGPTPPAMDGEINSEERALVAFQYSENEVDTFAHNWSKIITQKYQSILNQDLNVSLDDCSSSDSEAFYLQLSIRAEYKILLERMKNCTKISPLVTSYAGGAALKLGQNDLALNLYQSAITSGDTDVASVEGILLARYLYDFDRQIVENYPLWDAHKKKMIINFLRLANRMNADADVSPQDAILYARNEIKDSEGLYKEVLFSREVSRSMYQTDDSIYPIINEELAKMQNPSLWWASLYRILFATPDPIFKKAKIIYNAALPFMTIYSYFPTEDNVHTYSELYATECKENLLQGNAKNQYEALKKNWRDQKITTDSFYEQVDALKSNNVDQADVLTVKAVSLYDKGELDAALKTAFKAHQACPYFNRSHWVISSILQRKSLESYANYPELVAKRDSVVAKMTIPSEISKYVINWHALSEEHRKNTLWGLQQWIHLVPGLANNKSTAQIKFPFELMSEMYSMEEYRDVRAHYARDNRLWDDMRGAGGTEMISDYYQTNNAPFGDYNLFNHEMTHQVDRFLEDKNPKSYECLNKIFEQATKNNIFLTDYARHRGEYFAVNSEPFAVPVGYPERFGASVKWFELNDPDFVYFFKQLMQPNFEENLDCRLSH